MGGRQDSMSLTATAMTRTSALVLFPELRWPWGPGAVPPQIVHSLSSSAVYRKHGRLAQLGLGCPINKSCPGRAGMAVAVYIIETAVSKSNHALFHERMFPNCP